MGFAHSHFPTHHHIIQLFNIIHSAMKKTIQSYILDNEWWVEFPHGDKKIKNKKRLLLKYLPYLSICIGTCSWLLCLIACRLGLFEQSITEAFHVTRQSPLQPPSPFLSPRRLYQCSGWLCIGSCFWKQDWNSHLTSWLFYTCKAGRLTGRSSRNICYISSL